jgi:hypothetical protein
MAITQATALADFSTGIGTAGAVLQVDNADGRVGIGTTDPQADLQVGIAITMDGTAGVITASSFSGSGANLSTTERFDFSSNDFSPVDSPKVGIYFSPTDVVNDDIISSFANLDFNQLLGDPRDSFRLEYRDLKDSSNKYFQKYTGNNEKQSIVYTDRL